MALQRLLIEGLLTQLPASLIAAGLTALASWAVHRWRHRKAGDHATDQVVTAVPLAGPSKGD
jgi:hypothetical protein